MYTLLQEQDNAGYVDAVKQSVPILNKEKGIFTNMCSTVGFVHGDVGVLPSILHPSGKYFEIFSVS